MESNRILLSEPVNTAGSKDVAKLVDAASTWLTFNQSLCQTLRTRLWKFAEVFISEFDELLVIHGSRARDDEAIRGVMSLDVLDEVMTRNLADIFLRTWARRDDQQIVIL